MSAEGRLVAGRYRLQKRIGSGAMGVVWRAVDERLQRTVAAKQLLLQAGHTDEETEEARQRSMREGRIAARLQHQNAIAVFDVAEDDGQPVLLMEYLPSQSLASLLSEQGPVAPVSVARVGAQVAGALAAAHTAGIVHRDLKPGNILLGDNGVAKITDFGISRAIGDVSVTKSGILAGTPAYLSPEVALGRDPAPASDVFSLGSTLYAAIEGEPPFGVDENAISLLHRVARGQIEPPKQAGPMSTVLQQLLRADPLDRPTMKQARGLLQAVADGRPVPTSTPVRPPPQSGPPQAKPPQAGPAQPAHPQPAQPQPAHPQPAPPQPRSQPPVAQPPAIQREAPAPGAPTAGPPASAGSAPARHPAPGNPAVGNTPAGNARASPSPTAVGSRNDPADSGPPPQARDSFPERSKPQRAMVLWAMAIVIAILVGILAANAYGSQSTSGQAPPAPIPGNPGTPAAAPENASAPVQQPSAQHPHAQHPHARPRHAQRPGAEPPGGEDAEPATPTSAKSATVQPRGPRQPSPQEVVGVVSRYYSLVPKQLDESWNLLGPALQVQGKDAYQRWWNSVDDVQVVGQPRLVGDHVLTTLAFTSGGKRQLETHMLGMVVNENGDPLINTDNSR